MATAGKTARGLRRVPQYGPPQRETDREPKSEKREPREKRSRVRSVFGHGLDLPMFIFIMVLLAIGLVMLFSASYAYCYYRYDNSYYFILRQGGFAAIGVGLMLVFSLIDYHVYRAFSPLIYLGGIVLLVLLLIFGRFLHVEAIAPSEGEAVRWLKLGPLQFQPSELAKFALIVMCSARIQKHFEEMDTFRQGVVPFLWIVGLPAALVALENHLSGTLILLALGAILMFLGGTKFRWFILALIVLGAALYFYLNFTENYQASRVAVWRDPFDPALDRDASHQVRQSLYAIGSGGVLGVGLGQSRQKYLYLPEPQNDFIFAIVCEELGLVGALVIIILFALFIWRGVYVSLHAKDLFGTLLGLGITFQVGMQAVLNICVVTNTLPNTGISLPFFSYGGTALVVLLVEMGVLLNISRTANVEKT